MNANASHCLELVRAADKDRFLASLFSPDAKRPALLALYAFNIEIARVRESVSDPHIGEIRYQWWRDTLEAVYRGEAQAHPVAQELALAIAGASLPKATLLNMIEARSFDLYDDPMPDVASLEGYLGETSSALIQMAALVLAGPAAQAGAAAAGLAGVAQGLAGLIRSQQLHEARGQCFLPQGFDAVAHARMRLAEARALLHTIPAVALPAFLPASLTDLYLDRAGRPDAAVSQFRRQFTLWWRARQNRF